MKGEKNQMTKQVVAKRSLSEGTVQLEECIWDNGSVTYDVFDLYIFTGDK